MKRHPSWQAAVAYAREVADTVDAFASHLPDNTAQLHRAAAQGMLTHTLHEADDWDEYLSSTGLRGQMREAGATRQATIDDVMSRARDGEGFYDVLAREHRERRGDL